MPPHPIWPARWMLIGGLFGIGVYISAVLFVGYTLVHYALKYW